MYKQENHTPTVDVYSQFLTDMRASSNMARLPEEEVREHLHTYQNSASTPEQKAAAEYALFQSTARLIPYAIRRWGGKEIPAEELVGELYERLVACYKNFDLSYVSSKTEDIPAFAGYVLSSFYNTLISPRSFEDPQQVITISTHVKDFAGVLKKVWREYIAQYGHEPTDEEWYTLTCELTGKDIQRKTFDLTKQHGIDKPYVRIGKPVSTRNTVDEETLTVRQGLIENVLTDVDIQGEELVQHVDISEKVETMLCSLTQREQTVIRRRFGLRGEEPHTLEQIAAQLGGGATREKIRQIETKALRKLRHPSRSRKLEEYSEGIEANQPIAALPGKEYKDAFENVESAIRVVLLTLVKTTPETLFSLDSLKKLYSQIHDKSPEVIDEIVGKEGENTVSLYNTCVELSEQLAIPIGLILKRMGKEVHEHGFNPDMNSSSPHYTDALAQFTRSLERKQAEQKARTLMRS